MVGMAFNVLTSALVICGFFVGVIRRWLGKMHASLQVLMHTFMNINFNCSLHIIGPFLRGYTHTCILA